MLETIREYALERLDEAAETAELRRRHAEFFAALAEQAYEHRFDAEAEWAARLELDHDDLRAALDWLEANDADRALELAGALGWFWFSHGHLAEGVGRLAGVLSRSAATGRSRARALTASGALVARRGDVDDGRAQLDEAIGLWRELDDRDELASALDLLGWLLVYDAGDDPARCARSSRASSCAASSATRPERLARSSASPRCSWRWGRRSGPRRCHATCSRRPAATRAPSTSPTTSSPTARSSAATPRRPRRAIARACGRRFRSGDLIETSIEVQGVAMAAAGNGDAERALRLAGAVEALWESLGTDLHVAFWDALLERYIGAAREQLGAEAEAAWAEGRALAFDDAVELALAG